MFEVVTGVWNELMRFLIKTFSSLIVPTVPSSVSPSVMYNEEDDDMALAVRDTLYHAGVQFEDRSLTKDEYETEIRSMLPLQQKPVLYVNDEAKTILTQPQSMLRYASKLARTYPSNPVYAAIIDEWCDCHVEFMVHMTLMDKSASWYNRNPLKKYILETHIPQYMNLLNAEFEDNVWLGDFDQPSMADFCWYPTIKLLKSGAFDGIGETFFDAFPNIQRFLDDMENYDDDDTQTSTEEVQEDVVEKKKESKEE